MNTKRVNVGTNETEGTMPLFVVSGMHVDIVFGQASEHLNGKTICFIHISRGVAQGASGWGILPGGKVVPIGPRQPEIVRLASIVASVSQLRNVEVKQAIMDTLAAAVEAEVHAVVEQFVQSLPADAAQEVAAVDAVVVMVG